MGMATLEANGEQLARLSQALRSAFPPQRFRELLSFRLDKSLDDLAFGDDYPEVMFKVLSIANGEGWLSRLVVAARASNPGNPLLQAIGGSLGVSSSSSEEGNLERVVRSTGVWNDVDPWRTQLGSLEDRVCRVRVAGSTRIAFGTGFLIGPRAVLTNYHVVAMAIEKDRRRAAGEPWAEPAGIDLLFDYKVFADGRPLDDGNVVGVGEPWLIDSSPQSPADSKPDGAVLPTPEELDFAILRLEKAVGSAAIGRSPEPQAPARGWINLRSDPLEVSADAPVFLLQHPAKRPLKLTVGAMRGVNENATRVRYTANSVGGSSGAPCFDEAWRLIALHHSGDPDFDPDHQPEYNEGIPIALIANRLQAGGRISDVEAP